MKGIVSIASLVAVVGGMLWGLFSGMLIKVFIEKWMISTPLEKITGIGAGILVMGLVGILFMLIYSMLEDEGKLVKWLLILSMIFSLLYYVM